MIKRVCPLCGKEHYSAVEQDDWTCDNCGHNLTPEMNIRKTDDLIKTATELGKKIPAVAVNVEIPLLDDFKKDISEFREELEKTINELGDLLDRFNTKYGGLLKFSAEMDFKVEEV